MAIGIAEPRRKRQQVGAGWKELAKEYQASLLGNLRQLQDSDAVGSLREPLSEHEAQQIRESLVGGAQVIADHADELLAIVRRREYEPVLSGKTEQEVGTVGPVRPVRRKKQPAPTSARPVWGELVRVRVDNCVAHPANRQHAAEDVAARAESLRETGQLEAVKVWLQPERTQLVIGGWGRVLAARQLKLREIEARPLLGMLRDGQTVPPTQAELLGLLAEDNSQRTELTVLEKAELGGRLLEAGWTWDEAARRVGFENRGSLANAIKLTKLPETIRRRVDLPQDDKGYLPQAVVRRIADYAHVPEILQEIERDLDRDSDEWRSYPDDSLDFCVRGAVRPVDRGGASAMGAFSGVPPAAATLPTVTIPVWQDGERTEIAVTTNVAAWEAAAKKQPRDVADDDEEVDERPARAPKRELTPEEKRAEARQKAEQLQKRRDRWEYRWRHAFVCRRLQEEDVRPIQRAFWRAVLWAIAETHQTGRAKLADAVEATGYAKGLTRRYSSSEECVSYLPNDEAVLYQTLIDLVRSLVAEPETGNPDFPHVPRELVWSLCADLGFDAATEWEALHHSEPGRELQRDLWEAHETAQLQKVVAELPGVTPAGEKKRDLVEALIAGEIALPLWLRPAAPKKGKGRK